MTALFVTVLMTSLLGSLHCAGMCGGFLAIAVGGQDVSPTRTQLAYHGGRFIVYVTLGVIAGMLGQLVDLAGAMAGLQPIAVLFAAATTILFGVVTWLRTRGIRLNLFQPPKAVARLAHRLLDLAIKRRPSTRALIVGLSTTLLPCGWLYAFVAVAAGTASPLAGASVMLAFWLGTVPIMAALGLGVRGAFGFASARLPAISCAALVLVGLYTVLTRAHLAPAALFKSAEASHVEGSTTLSVTPACCESNQ